ncbi:hypothetical protein DFA_11165 [Cavenderia fasciculata]|uniref:Uncharacterized protein n=1 Tax=Cavenderia fasciculata TaxID=261658 RepID=F4QF97_CACFS|nr:uncharacterized protein DFA_11165 [Cavenderia fasciculata]EGG13404.1 hypothetical protein DFA_11165 [Cavenderia fasciculata]|eukprot:XP_004350108.1 hypothetical protein DFA_11165 [Cavenderia fasciculata]
MNRASAKKKKSGGGGEKLNVDGQEHSLGALMKLMKFRDEIGVEKAFKGMKNPMLTNRRDTIAFHKKEHARLVGDKEFKLYTTTTNKDSLAKEPSTKSLSELKPIEITDLLIETIHKGSVLIVRSIVESFKMNAIQILVEDQKAGPNSDVALTVSLYNFVFSGKGTMSDLVDKTFPVGVIMAIKEPYFKITLSGGYAVRVENPQDIEVGKIRCDPSCPRILTGGVYVEIAFIQAVTMSWR